jgi:hypothetical protein
MIRWGEERQEKKWSNWTLAVLGNLKKLEISVQLIVIY